MCVGAYDQTHTDIPIGNYDDWTEKRITTMGIVMCHLSQKIMRNWELHKMPQPTKKKHLQQLMNSLYLQNKMCICGLFAVFLYKNTKKKPFFLSQSKASQHFKWLYVVCWIITRYGYYIHNSLCGLCSTVDILTPCTYVANSHTRQNRLTFVCYMIFEPCSRLRLSGNFTHLFLFFSLHLCFKLWPRYFSLFNRNRF